MTWSDVGLAGSFIAGLIVGGFGVIRVTRAVLEYMRHERARDE